MNMPYLNSKIEQNKHRKGCDNPVGKRLYIRDYDDDGKQRFVSWGLTCTTCGVVVKEEYERNLTRQERHFKDRQLLDWKRYRKAEQKIKRLQRKKLGPTSMSPEEVGLRTRIRHLKEFYELMSLHWGDLDIAWDDELVEKFLNISPRPTKRELAEVFQPSWSKVNVDSQKWRKYVGYIDDPDKQGWLKYDREKYKDLLESETLKRQDMMRDIIKSREVK